MRYLLIITCLAILPVLAHASSQYIELRLKSSPKNTITVLGESELIDGTIGSNYAIVDHVNDFVDTYYTLEILDNLEAGTSLKFTVYINSIPYPLSLSNFSITSDSTNFLDRSIGIQEGDIITIGIYNQQVYLLKNTEAISIVNGPLLVQDIYARLDMYSANDTEVKIDTDEFEPEEFSVVFEQSSTTLYEGDTLEVCVVLDGGYSASDTIEISIGVAHEHSLPHLEGFETISVTFYPGDTIACLEIPIPIVEECFGNSEDYIYLITETSEDYVDISSVTPFFITILNISSPENLTNLYPGDILIRGFDNEIDQDGTDKIALTNLVPLWPGMAFSLTNAYFLDGLWYDEEEEGIKSQQIEYLGDCVIEPGSILCMKVPATGSGNALLVYDIEINGQLQDTLFEISNNGFDPDPNINLPEGPGGRLFTIFGSWVPVSSSNGFLIGTPLHGLVLEDALGSTEIHPLIDSITFVIENLPASSSYGYMYCDNVNTQCGYLLSFDIETDVDLNSGTSTDDLDRYEICSDECEFIDCTGYCSYYADADANGDSILGISINNILLNLENLPYFSLDGEMDDSELFAEDVELYINEVEGRGDAIMLKGKELFFSINCTDIKPDFLQLLHFGDTTISYFGTCCTDSLCSYFAVWDTTFEMISELQTAFGSIISELDLNLPSSRLILSDSIIYTIRNSEGKFYGISPCNFVVDTVNIFTQDASFVLEIVNTNAPISKLTVFDEMADSLLHLSFVQHCNGGPIFALNSIPKINKERIFGIKPLLSFLAHQEGVLELKPNPATNNLYIKFESLFPENAIVSIINSTGSLVREIRVLKDIGIQSIDLDITVILPGIYFISLESSEGYPPSKIVIIK